MNELKRDSAGNSPQKTNFKTNERTQKDNRIQHYYSVEPAVPLNIYKLYFSLNQISFSLESATGVFSYEKIDKGTQNLIKYLQIPPSLRLILEGRTDERPSRQINILDAGAGYGPIAIYMEKYIKELLLSKSRIRPPEEFIKIYTIEINKRAHWLLKRNLHSNQCSLVKPIRGDFHQIAEQFVEENILFDAIYTNPPLKLGHKYLLNFFDTAISLLKENGIIQYVHKKSLGANGFLNKILKKHPEIYHTIIKKVGGYFIIILSRIPAENLLY